MASEPTFSYVDYILFGLTLLGSSLVGLYYAFQMRRSGPYSNEKFLMGDRDLPLLPTALSLMTSFVSGITILSYPSEIYTMGSAFVWSWLGAVVSVCITGIFIVPVFFHVKSINLYQYLEDRFESKLLRFIGSLNFTISTLVYMAVVLYAPSIALSAATGVATWIFIVSVGIVCTIYTTIGGLKAVIWTDTFQAGIMISGLIALLVKGLMAVGGFNAAWDTARQAGRTAGFTNIDPNPAQYMTVWTAAFGGAFFWMSAFSSNQVALQRYCSLSTLRKAQIVSLLNVPALSLIFGIVFVIGLLMFANYADCDPLKSGKINSRDQLVIYYMLDMLSSLNGLPGLFMACIFSGTLSTISSGINAMAAVGLEDWVRPVIQSLGLRRKGDETSSPLLSDSVITKLLAIVYGAITIGLAFAAQPLGGILQTCLGVLGCLAGPGLGLILLGVLIPWGNRHGALLGFLVAVGFNAWIFAGRITLKPDGAYALPTSICGCNHTQGGNLSYITNWAHATTKPPVNFIVSAYMNDSRGTVAYIANPAPVSETSTCAVDFSSGNYSVGAPFVEREGLDWLYSLSNLMMPLIGTMIVMVLGSVVSAATGGTSVSRYSPELVYWSAVRLRSGYIVK